MNLKEKIQKMPSEPGVYLMKDCRNRVLYVGKAKSLKHRVQSYFQASSDLPPKVNTLMTQVKKVDYLETGSEIDALLMEARLIRDIQPKYNVDLRDDKTFPLLAVSHEDFPRVFITRDRGKANLTYYGPFTQTGDLRSALKVLQRIFKFRTCRLKISESLSPAHRPCLLFHINQCVAPCINKINKSDYAEIIRSLHNFLGNRKTILLKRLEEKMNRSSAGQDFEKAAFYRDQIQSVNAISQTGRMGDFYEGSLAALSPAERLKNLQKLLGLTQLPRKIEGVDISDIKGTDAVGALVSFIDGEPFKAGYRRYRIKQASEGAPDDYGRLAEVIKRRYQSFGENNQGDDILPDVLLIDGGSGHLHTALRVFQSLGVKPPVLAGLAKGKTVGKKFRTGRTSDTLYITGEDSSVKSRPFREGEDSGFKLLQYVRDEAHRFAQKYHHLLRKKKMYL